MHHVQWKVGMRQEWSTPSDASLEGPAVFRQTRQSPAYKAWIEQKANVSLLMAGQTATPSGNSRAVYCGAKSKTEFQLCAVWSFRLEGLISSFSVVLTMRPCLTAQLLTWPLSSAPYCVFVIGLQLMANQIKTTKTDAKKEETEASLGQLVYHPNAELMKC